MGNSFVFPSPRSSYEASKEDESLIFIPTMVESNKCHTLACYARKTEVSIPCRYIQNKSQKSPYLVLFFHGNSEDIGPRLSLFLSIFAERFTFNVLCPEYPTYGVYRNRNTSLSMEEAILEDARKTIKYANQELRYPLENIILVGRSLGSGVAIQMATQFKVGGLVVVSAYTAIRDIAKRVVGSLLSKVVSDMFRSVDAVEQIKCPVLYIHGAKDTLIPSDMSAKLFKKTKVPKELKINSEMTHNEFKIEADFFYHIEEFLVNKVSLAHHLLNIPSCETYPIETLGTRAFSQLIINEDQGSPETKSTKLLPIVSKEDVKVET